MLHSGMIAVEDGHYTEAIPLLQRVLQDSPAISAAQMQLGIAFARVKRYPEAIPALRKAVELMPDSTPAQYELGLALFETGEWQQSATYFEFVAKKSTSVEEVNGAIERAASQQLKGILSFTTSPNVSIDFNHDSHSSVFHMDQTKVMDGTLVRVMSWYDNEWGFSNRMTDTAAAMAKVI